MATVAPRLPGLHFETARPVAPLGLPRMDVAAFVGFASAGPVGVPVVVDDEVSFRSIFGADLPIAWDVERGEMSHANLAPAVREFFRNGGRRCWIVQVADERVESAVLRLPGMLVGDRRSIHAGYLVAASPGSWSDGMSVNAALQADHGTAAEFTRTSRGPRLGVESPDLLRVVWADGTLGFFPAEPIPRAGDATRAERRAAAVRKFSSARWFIPVSFGALATPGRHLAFLNGPRREGLHPAGWQVVGAGEDRRLEVVLAANGAPQLSPGGWLRAELATVPSTPEGGSRVYLLVDDILRETSETRVVVRRAWRTLSPSASWNRVRGMPYESALLSLELWIRAASATVVRVPDLGLGAEHPHFLGAYPTDQERYGRKPTASPSIDTERTPGAYPPRLPVAAPNALRREFWQQERNLALIPLGIPTIARDDFFQAASTTTREPLRRDGLGAFSSRLFLDPRLAELEPERLIPAAFDYTYVREPSAPPVRLHALLPVEETSLIAVPDAVHTGWRRGTGASRTPPAPPEAPQLTVPIQEADEDGMLTVSWSTVEEALTYRLEHSATPRFDSGVWERSTAPGVDDEPTRARVRLSDPCATRTYFRVRARGEAGFSAWSATALLGPPASSFDVCGVAPLEPPVFTSIYLEGERLVLRWASAPESAALAAARAALERRFLVESSPEPSFAATTRVYEGVDRSVELWRPTSGSVYFRVASSLRVPDGATDAGLHLLEEDSPWSETVAYGVPAPPRWETIPPAESTGAVAGMVHEALLRFCAARSDCFAVLSLPRHFRQDDALSHVARLTTAVGAVGGETGDPGNRTLSFGALYHPWTVVRSPATALPLRPVPPDGAMCGVMAARANELGPWAAPANRTLGGVATLEPKLPENLRATWFGNRINAVAPFAGGFMVWSEETLSGDPDLRGIGVRRLLIVLRRLALREGDRYVFQPNDAAFRRLIQRQFDELLGDLFVRGAFAGATHAEGYQVVTDSTVNPPQSVDLGRFVVELRVAPSHPLHFLTVRLLQSGTGITVVER